MKEKRKKEGMEEETRAFNVGCLLDLAMLKKKRKKKILPIQKFIVSLDLLSRKAEYKTVPIKI